MPFYLMKIFLLFCFELNWIDWDKTKLILRLLYYDDNIFQKNFEFIFFFQKIAFYNIFQHFSWRIYISYVFCIKFINEMNNLLMWTNNFCKWLQYLIKISHTLFEFQCVPCFTTGKNWMILSDNEVSFHGY